MAFKIGRRFFLNEAEKVAKELLGMILVRKIGKKVLKAKIVETEAYLDENDPASWARLGKRKDNFFMWEEGGTILLKNVHKYLMLNFVTYRKGKAQAVLIRALEPLNFKGRCSGPGLLTNCLKIDRSFNGNKIYENKSFWIEDSKERLNQEIKESFRVGVKKDHKNKLRFYIKDNEYLSRK
ncbi:MAG: DNA-3-methyladenine glycosylase [Candidatus Pacearchaeota archaeon]